MEEWEFDALDAKTVVDHLVIENVEVGVGARVRLRPRQGGDIMDLALAGKTATIESIEQDYEGCFHLAVVLDDDPGRDLGLARQPGHRFFFEPGEIEPLPYAATDEDASAATATRILIAGIGNIFLGDDGFGVEVAQRLAGTPLPAGVRVGDFGVRGFDLACALDGPDLTILVDAYPHGQPPGTVTVIEPDLSSVPGPQPGQPAFEPHGLDPVGVLRLAATLDIKPRRLLLVGCEPLTLGGDEGAMGLSEPVAAAVNRAVATIEGLVNDMRRGASAPQ